MSSRTESSVHRPTAARGKAAGALPSSMASPSVSAAPDQSATHAMSCAMVAVATSSRRAPAPPSPSWSWKRKSCLPVVASSTCVASTHAIEIWCPSGTRHSCRSTMPSTATSRSAAAVACSTCASPRLAQYTVAASASKPASSTSPSSSSTMASTRVSEMKESTMWLAWPPPERSAHMPLMPCSARLAWSLMPMPLRTMRSEPSLYAPLQVTTCPCPCRSRSTTTKSTIGPKLE
mmetsp:Transcript_26148/g.66349  ORF Transcript_26148/g.66349 Transcript_26148/m.66349 type:complete len:234 (+) Transcript_26148:631-1332(+)